MEGYPQIDSYTYDEFSQKTDVSFVSDPDYGPYPISYNGSTYWKPAYSVDSEEGNVHKNYNFSIEKMKQLEFSCNNSATRSFHGLVVPNRGTQSLFQKSEHLLPQ